MTYTKTLDEYEVNADGVVSNVSILSSDEESVPSYEINIPKMGTGMEALVANLQDEISELVPLQVEGVTDVGELKKIKLKFYDQVKELLTHHLPQERKLDVIAGIVVHQMYGLGFIDVILADDFLEEIAINGSQQNIALFHKKHGWCKTNISLKNEEEIYNLSSQIGRKVGREINSLNPIMDAHLLTGDRVASTLFPITTGGNTITIRRFSRIPWTIVHLISPEFQTLSVEIAALLWISIQYEFNILVAGGTASGKTSLISALGAFFPPNQRIISIEDTREISLPKDLHWNWVPMTTRQSNPEGKGEITMLDLMISSLRMRPDRIVVGEVRRKEQAETMFEAMHTGHSVYTTLHADSVEQVKRRLLESPIEIPMVQVESLHLVLVQFRDRRKGIRRSLELSEVLMGNEQLTFNHLFRWRPRSDTFEKVNESIRLAEDLNTHTGMTPQEMKADLKEKEKILLWMLDNGIKDIDDVGSVMRLYYKNKDKLISVIDDKKDPSEFLNNKQE